MRAFTAVLVAVGVLDVADAVLNEGRFAAVFIEAIRNAVSAMGG